MTTFPNTPRLQRGAIVAVNPTGPPRVVVFQYNPDTLTRTLTARTVGNEGDKGDVLRLKGPPEETIKLDVEIDVADLLEQGNTIKPKVDIHQELAALELLLYPESGRIIDNEQRLSRGELEIIPPAAPLTLLVWGKQRVLPVRLSSLSITEEAFNADLNPVRAKISLDLRVLSYQELGLKSVGGSLFMDHHIAKEKLAKYGSLANLSFAIELGKANRYVGEEDSHV
jgi:hypothetical protein